MTIDEVRAIQRAKELFDKHVVWIGSTGFAIAHTDEERMLAAQYPAAMPLEDCDLHQWLEWQIDQPEPDGVYVVEHDGDRWVFHETR
jgi:hypothetical protein